MKPAETDISLQIKKDIINLGKKERTEIAKIDITPFVTVIPIENEQRFNKK